MDSDGLPIVGPGVDYSKVGSINQKRMLSFMNHFILYTVRFLNKFSGDCEEKLENLNMKILKIETCLSILEAKLASIPGLENVEANVIKENQDVRPAENNAIGESPEKTNGPVTTSADSQNVPESANLEPVKEESVEPPVMTVSQDSRYAKYFKMLNVGVPPPAIKLKMSSEGLDPDLLDNPDAPAPSGGETVAQNIPRHSDSDSDDSASSFSD